MVTDKHGTISLMTQVLEQPTAPEGEPRNFEVAFLPATPALAGSPALTAEFFDAIENAGLKALVVEGYAAGTTPEALNPFIARTVQRGVPVFVLSNNPGEDHGPQRIKYAVHQQAVDAGATILRGVNINAAEEVANAIQDAIDAGKTGQDLAQALIDIYGALGEEA